MPLPTLYLRPGWFAAAANLVCRSPVPRSTAPPFPTSRPPPQQTAPVACQPTAHQHEPRRVTTRSLPPAIGDLRRTTRPLCHYGPPAQRARLANYHAEMSRRDLQHLLQPRVRSSSRRTDLCGRPSIHAKQIPHESAPPSSRCSACGTYAAASVRSLGGESVGR